MGGAATRLDDFVPAWQFREFRRRRIDARPEAAYATMCRVRQDDILLFQTLNSLLIPDGSGTIISTETRVFSNGAETRRRFARYWRMIYPGSALIRRMWLRAIDLNSQ